MNKKIFYSFAFLIVFFITCSRIFPQTLSPETIPYNYLIYFKDKGEYKTGDKLPVGSDGYNLAKSFLSDKALWRRSKVLPEDEVVNYNDLPVKQEYVDAIKKIGLKINAVSRWFNAVSVITTKDTLDLIKKLGFVYKIEGVGFLEYSKIKTNTRNVSLHDSVSVKRRLKYNYGPSFWQNELINIPILHYCGITGWGSRVGMCDNGFNWRKQEALLTRKVLGEFDWIFKDDTAQYQAPPNQFPGDIYDQDGHGTMTMSTLGGFSEGKLIGPAFDAEFYLSKTEDDRSETPVEEDYWLEAVEWMEAQGVDIISSSLIYKPFDPPNNDYEYKDMNGKTTVIARAADYAVYLGVVVVNSMGNERQTKIPSIVSPPDGDSVISVGAVDSTSRIAYFSSNGPTSDGRTKPDVVAMGVNVFVAVTYSDTRNDSTFTYADGTSFSCPLTSGVCALILSAHPELTPMQVREALRMTANNKDVPNNVYGWGLVNSYDAVLYWGMAMSNKPEVNVTGDVAYISTYVLSKNKIDENSVKLYYSEDDQTNFSEAKMNLAEKLDETNSGKYSVEIMLDKGITDLKLYFAALDTEKNLTWPYGSPDKFFIYHTLTNQIEIY